jgi:predicted ribosome quality control (RQC) complex YloA/Tae2 family protein
VQVADLVGTGEPVTIPLDPTLDVVQNAQRLYRKQRRAAAGREHAEQRWLQTAERVQALRQVMDCIAEAADDELEEAAAALGELVPSAAPGGEPSRTGAPRRRREKSARALPFRRYRAADGTDIWVGRDARSNHELTFHHARGRDIWLHTRDRPGAHGVIRMDRQGPPSRETLLDAATLVAHRSGLKPGDAVDIAHTARKNVRAAAGTRPGQVYVSDARGLYLVVDDSRLQRLLATVH